MLGFSLGTYALVFSLLTSRLRLALRETEAADGVSYLEQLNALFIHRIIFQIVALLFAYLYTGTTVFDLLSVFLSGPEVRTVLRPLQISGSFIGSLLLLYSIANLVSAALAVFRLGDILNVHGEQ
jgi:hypothetical protein